VRHAAAPVSGPEFTDMTATQSTETMNLLTNKKLHSRRVWAPVTIALVLFAAGLGGVVPASTAGGAADPVRAVTAETGKMVQEASQAGGSKLEEVWRRIDERRLKNRSPDEIVAWLLIGLLVAGLIHQFSKLNKVATLLLGLGGAFLGGIVGNLVGFDIGMGPVLIRYEELLASMVGGILIIVAARCLAAKREPEE
jgi:hypothetical protein